MTHLGLSRVLNVATADRTRERRLSARRVVVVPADLELLDLLDDALGDLPAAGRDHPPRHQVKGASWVDERQQLRLLPLVAAF